jgi:putative aldouronate transport system substrate-binding protein
MCFVLAAALFAGGQRSGTTAARTSRVGAKGSIPLATNRPTLTMFVGRGYQDNLTSFAYNDNLFTRKIVDETGINLQVSSTTAADVGTRLTLMLNTGDYPDIIFADVDMNYYAQQGIFVALDDYDPLSFPRIKQVFDYFTATRDMVTGGDGKIYGLPDVSECIHCDYAYGRLFYYMPWIRDNNRKIPETLDEFADFLRWSRNSDPNKNGRRDELGVLLTKGDLYNFLAYIAKAYMPFGYTGDHFGVVLDSNRRVVEQYRDDNFRAALAYLAGLYNEGLIIPDGFSMEADQARVLARSQDTITPIWASSWSLVDWVTDARDKYMEYFVLPPLRTASGQRYASNGPSWGKISPKYFVTDKCRDPELAVALYDYLIGGDNWKDVNGPKGEYWDDPDPGALGMDGRPAIAKQIGDVTQVPMNHAWYYFNAPMVLYPEQRYGYQTPNVDMMIRYITTGDATLKDRVSALMSYGEFQWFYQANESTKYAMPDSMFIPPVKMNEADSSRYGDIGAVLNPFKQQVFVEFITGVRDINNNTHWNNYLSELDRLGSREMVQILQRYIR